MMNAAVAEAVAIMWQGMAGIMVVMGILAGVVGGAIVLFARRK